MKYIFMNLYFSKILNNIKFNNIKEIIFVKMQIKNLKINILIETNVFTSYKFLLNYVF